MALCMAATAQMVPGMETLMTLTSAAKWLIAGAFYGGICTALGLFWGYALAQVAKP